MEQKSEEKKTRKIAILEGDYPYGEGMDNQFLVSHITDWTEVTEEEFDALNKYRFHTNPPYYILEQVSVEERVKKAMPYYLAQAEKLKIARERQEAATRQAAAAAARRKAENNKRKLERLAAEAGVVLVPRSEVTK